MDRVTPAPCIEAIEAALTDIGAVKAVRVVSDDFGVIQEIHVLALPVKQPKQIARDIETTLMACFGIPIDHRKISIAQLNSGTIDQAVAVEVTPAPDQPRILAVRSSVNGSIAMAEVTLELCGEEHSGFAKSPASQTARMRLAALATLDALKHYVSDDHLFALEDIAVVKLGKESVAVACVSLVTRHGEVPFGGSALVRHNDIDAIVRATLSAVNRSVVELLTAE